MGTSQKQSSLLQLNLSLSFLPGTGPGSPGWVPGPTHSPLCSPSGDSIFPLPFHLAHISWACPTCLAKSRALGPDKPLRFSRGVNLGPGVADREAGPGWTWPEQALSPHPSPLWRGWAATGAGSLPCCHGSRRASREPSMPWQSLSLKNGSCSSRLFPGTQDLRRLQAWSALWPGGRASRDAEGPGGRGPLVPGGRP